MTNKPPMTDDFKEAASALLRMVHYGQAQDCDHDAVRRENPLPQQGWPLEVSQGFRLGHRRYHEAHGSKMIAEIKALRAEISDLKAQVRYLDYHARAMTQIAAGRSKKNITLDSTLATPEPDPHCGCGGMKLAELDYCKDCL